MEFFIREVYPWLREISVYSPLLPFAAGILLIGKHRSNQFWLFFLYVLLMVVVELIGVLTIYLGTKNNLWVSHVYTAFEFSILAVIYYHSFRRPVFKRGIIVAAVFFFILSIGDAILGEGITQMNSLPKMIENVLLIGIAVLYFYKVANDLKITYLDQDPVFLLSCGLLIHKAGSSMSFAMFNTALAESYDAARMCLAIVFVLNILFNTSLVFMLQRTPAK